MLDKVRSGRPRTSKENIDHLRHAFAGSPTNSIRTAAIQLELPRSTVYKVLHKNLRLLAYIVQLLLISTSHHFQARSCITTLRTACSPFPQSNIFRPMDWNGWATSMAQRSPDITTLDFFL